MSRRAAIFACITFFSALSACGGSAADGSVEPTDDGGPTGDGAGDGAGDDAAMEAEAPPPDPCASAACPTHATCKVVDGAATCPCDTGYLSWKDGCSIDADKDGISEDEELAVATELAPVMVFDTGETLSARRTHFAVSPTADGGRSVYYAHSYFDDGGSVLGITKHLGDSEFIVVTRNAAGDVSLFLSAHYKASTDASQWYPLSKFEKQTVGGVSRPVVFIALRKHGNYPDLATCEAGAYHLDTCSRGLSELVPVVADRNLGQSSAPLLDDVEFNGNHEYYWTDAPFCGWHVAGGLTADRSGCTPPENAYGRQLRAWETGML
jgi:hypothetical protein